LNDLNNRIAKDAGNPSLYFQRADIYDELNDFTKANNDYKKVLELYQNKPDAKYIGEYTKSCYRLADDYFFRNSLKDEAMKYVEDGLKASPNFKDLEILEAVILGADDSKADLAGKKYEIVAKKYPDDNRLNMYYAKFLEKSRPLEAAMYYEKVVAADPSNKKALLSLGTIYNNEANRLASGTASDNTKEVYDNAKKASTYFEKLHEINPDDKEITNILVQIYNELNEQEKAKKLNAPY
jgi:tetratricopeptide (TPR) repeat protein